MPDVAEAKKPTEKTTKPRTEEMEVQMAAAFSGPAVLANRFFVTPTLSGIRIAFAEQAPNKVPVFRTGVVLSFPDCINLYKMLQQALKPIEAGIEAQKSAAKGETKQ